MGQETVLSVGGGALVIELNEKSILNFSAPAYFGAVAVACVLLAAPLTAMALSSAVPLDMAEFALIVLICLVGLAVSFGLAVVIFLPATLASLWLVRWYGLRSAFEFGILGALSAVATGATAILLIQVPGPPLPEGSGSANATILASLAIAGIVAGLTYRWLDNRSRRKHGHVN